MNERTFEVIVDLTEIDWEGMCFVCVAGGEWDEWWGVLNTMIGRRCP